MTAIRLDQVQNRLLVKETSTILADQVQLRLLVTDHEIDVISYTKTYREYLISSIKAEETVPFKDRYFIFGEPVTLTEGNLNTSILVSLEEGAGTQGSKTLYYNRAPIEHILVGKDIHEDFKPKLDALVTTRDLLREFNTKYSTKIPLEDILDVEMIPSEDVIFTATVDSYFFIPGSTVNMGFYLGSAKYGDLPLGELTWPVIFLEGIWTQGLDMSIVSTDIRFTTNHGWKVTNDYLEKFYLDHADVPKVGHPLIPLGLALAHVVPTTATNNGRSNLDYNMVASCRPTGFSTDILFPL